MNAIITVVGNDKVGIIAAVSSFLAEHKINIADITQTILSGNFVMMMMVSFENADIAIDELREALSKKAEEMNVEINVMSEKVFSAMHRV
ncbi:MAG: ACT domain-containing protein [Treponema sp.]|nr:ACT domain-containing protein [Treponema sp.]